MSSAGSKVKRRHRKVHGKISFMDLACVIADRWNDLDAQVKYVFEEVAAAANETYKSDLKEWKTGKNDSSGTTTKTSNAQKIKVAIRK
jgi:hypothetical protein